jgi:3-deoxy-manno-octulosonate cytidylyltransferase (CMP-KDO synthetase)
VHEASARSAVVAIIPARFGSTRLPGKPLADIHGRPLVTWVLERVRQARSLDRILVATDDERVAAAVRSFGAEAVLTSPGHATGSDRLAEAAQGLDADVIVNVQGDEPFIDPGCIDAAVAALRADPQLPLATLSLPLRDPEEMLSPSVVKVVTDGAGNALYFSRSPIPWVRCAGTPSPRLAAEAAVAHGLARKHVGLYAYRRDALLRFAALGPAALERAEGLEQLRALAHGIRIRVLPWEGAAGMAVDTPEDLERARALLTPIGGARV